MNRSDAGRGRGPGTLGPLKQLHAELGEHVADLVQRVNAEALVDLVAMSGQTGHHVPRVELALGWSTRATLQLGEVGRVAERCWVPVVSYLRHSDLAADGGSPPVSFGDRLLYGHEGLARAVAIPGGIANVTRLPPDLYPD